MNASKKKEFESLKRVDGFANTEWPPLANAPQGYHDQLAVMRNALSDADKLFAEQQSGAYPKSVARRAQLRHELRALHLLPLRRIARVMSRSTAGIPRIINLPHKNVPEQTLLAAAKAALEDAAPYHAQFVARGAKPDFLDRLRDAITAVEQARDESNMLRTRSIKATAGIDESLITGRDAIRCMDTVVRSACAADKTHGDRTLAAWDNASRVERVGALAEKESVVPLRQVGDTHV